MSHVSNTGSDCRIIVKLNFKAIQREIVDWIYLAEFKNQF